MKRWKKLAAATTALLTTLTMAACTDDGTEETANTAAPETVTETVEPTDVPESETNAARGNPEQIGGECATTDNRDKIIAGDDTSCGLANATYDKLFDVDYEPWTPHSHAPAKQLAKFEVTDPTTDQAQQLECLVTDDHAAVTCKENLRGPTNIFVKVQSTDRSNLIGDRLPIDWN